jgi:hypothetical protein
VKSGECRPLTAKSPAIDRKAGTAKPGPVYGSMTTPRRLHPPSRSRPQRTVLIGQFSPTTDEHWNGVLSIYAKTGYWTRYIEVFGPDPTSAACRAPRHLLVKHGLVTERAA